MPNNQMEPTLPPVLFARPYARFQLHFFFKTMSLVKEAHLRMLASERGGEPSATGDSS